MSIFEFDTQYQRQQAMLALFGLFMIIPAAAMGFLLTGIFVAPGLAIAGGLSAVMVVGGFLGYFTVVVDRAVKEVTIKVVQQ